MDRLILWVLAGFGFVSLVLRLGTKLAADLERFLEAWRGPVSRVRRWLARRHNGDGPA